MSILGFDSEDTLGHGEERFNNLKALAETPWSEDTNGIEIGSSISNILKSWLKDDKI